MGFSGVKDANECEKPACGFDIEFYFIAQSIHEEFGALVMDASAAHINGFNARWFAFTYGIVIALADHEVILDDAPVRIE